MHSDSGATESIWMETIDTPSFPTLARDIRADVCVIGAGISGLTTAYLLAHAGKSVVVLEAGHVGGSETGRTTAHLTAVLDERYYRIASLHGEDGARLAAESHMAAINRMEAIAALEEIDCDFERVDGFLFLAPDDEHELLEKELVAAHQAGLTDAELDEATPVGGLDTGPVLRFPRQAQFHPLKYLSGLAEAIIRDGGEIYCATKVTSIEGGEPAIVTTEGEHTVHATEIVVATNSPINDWMMMHTKQAPYRSYVIGVRIPAGTLRHQLLWDTADPYHYIRVQGTAAHPRAQHELLLVGGEDHKTGQAGDTEQRFASLEQWTRRCFPMAEEVVYHWSGQLLEPVDGLAFIGKNPGNDKHIYIITGQSGNGMTYGTIGGMVITDLILGRDNPWAKLYDPSRISFRSALEFTRENLNVAEQYAQYLTPGDVGSVDDITPGSGALIRRGMHKIAAYKDESGHVTECSAVCPHLYGIVVWNETEKTWDCPCHGSRFDRHGRVITGPAVADLEEVHVLIDR